METFPDVGNQACKCWEPSLALDEKPHGNVVLLPLLISPPVERGRY